MKQDYYASIGFYGVLCGLGSVLCLMIFYSVAAFRSSDQAKEPGAVRLPGDEAELEEWERHRGNASSRTAFDWHCHAGAVRFLHLADKVAGEYSRIFG